jgi:hypothetical protein
MSTLRAALCFLLALFFAGAVTAQPASVDPVNHPNDKDPSLGAPVKVSSPNGQITLLLFDAGTAQSSGDGSAGQAQAAAGLSYAVEFAGQRMMEQARLGLELAGQPALGPGMHLKATQPESADETYTIPVGKSSTVRNHYNGVRADFEDGSGRKLSVEVRAFDDGVAFRYVVP